MSKVTNLSKKVEGKPILWSAGKIYGMHKNGKFHYDRERLQRLLVPWPLTKVNSYLYTMFNGASVKDCFQFAEIAPIVEHLKEQIKRNTEDADLDFLQENLDYFQNLLSQGVEYLVLDGQHRIDTIVSYMDDGHNFKPKERILFRKEGEQGTISLSGKFSKLDEDIQNHIVNEIPFIVVVYEKGDLRELAHIFITSNSMMPMTEHEKRILNYNPLNRWLTEVCNTDVIMKDMFKTIGSMSGEYSLDHKGDTLFLSEMLMYVNNNKYEGYDHDVLDDVLGPYPSGTVKVSKSEQEMTKKIFRIMADGCAAMEQKHLKKFSKSSLYNLFYTISFVLQKGNIWGKQYGIDGAYSITKKEEFVKWFFDEEHKRVKDPNAKMSFTNPITGKVNSQKHEYSFLAHNAQQNHSVKQSVKGQGGSKYTFADWARVRYLLEDLNSNLSNLEKRGIITKLGDRNTMSRDEALVALNVPLSMSDNIEIDENVPVAKGGKREEGNIVALTKDQNRTKGKRTRAVSI